MRASYLSLLLTACVGATDPTPQALDDAQVAPEQIEASPGAFDAGLQPFIPPNKTPADAGNPWCQNLFCYQAVELLPGCAVECTLLPVQHLIFGPQCQTCANPVDVSACGYFCVGSEDF